MLIPLIRTGNQMFCGDPEPTADDFEAALRPSLGESNACSSNGTHRYELLAAGAPNRTLRMSCRRESYIAAMTDRVELTRTPVHTGIRRLAMVVVISGGYIGWHDRAAPNAAAAAPDGELVKVAFTEGRDVKEGALIRTLTGTRGRFRSRW